MSASEFQEQFSAVLDTVKNGETVEITSPVNGEAVAVLLPADQYEAKTPRKLGLLEGKAKVIIHDNWEMTDEEFLNS